MNPNHEEYYKRVEGRNELRRQSGRTDMLPKPQHNTLKVYTDNTRPILNKYFNTIKELE